MTARSGADLGQDTQRISGAVGEVQRPAWPQHPHHLCEPVPKERMVVHDQNICHAVPRIGGKGFWLTAKKDRYRRIRRSAFAYLGNLPCESGLPLLFNGRRSEWTLTKPN